MIPLVVRSGYSFGWGTNSIKEICRHARRLGYDRMALTDTDNLCGLTEFISACESEGIRPIVGAGITDPKTPARVVCLVKDREGYENLCRLLTRRHMAPDFTLEADLVAHSKGLVVLTTSPEMLYAGCGAGLDMAVALPRKPLPPDHVLSRAARRTGVPLVAVPASFFNEPGEYTVHRILRAIDKNTTTSRLGSADTAPADAFLASPEYYRDRFNVCPEAIDNTAAIAERLTFSRLGFGLVMPPWEGASPEQTSAHLREAAYEGARRRYGELTEAVVDRLEHEFRLISQKGFCGYFLIVAEIVRHSPRTCGRGSGAASLVAYCLGITNVCPVKHNLYFERFLNPGRTDPPDIDVDFAWDERDAVIGAVLEKYKGRAAMVCNHVCFQPRMAIRETARVFGLTNGEITRVTGKLPWSFQVEETGAGKTGTEEPGEGEGATGGWGEAAARRIAALPRMRGIDLSPPWPAVLSIAARITGLPRYLSVHSGGVVITPGPIDAYVPIQNAPKGVPILQWDKDAAEDAGLVKIDLLGNRSLGVIRDAIANLAENRVAVNDVPGDVSGDMSGDVPFDAPIDADWAPEDDFATRDTVARGETMGCFYIESPAMRMLQRKTRVGDFEHLVIHSSIIRPAANDVIQDYIHRLHGGGWEPIHPVMDEVLAETFGLMVFQEDVSRVAVAVAGFSHEDADGLRKVMSRKDRAQRLRDYYGRFASGARLRGFDDGKIERVWQMIMSFNGYSFCKPHSASYAKVSFEAAYLKTHYPAAFMAAVISNQGGFYSAFAYVSEAMRMGIRILPPDVGESHIRWKGHDKAMRVGLLSIKGLSAATMDRIVAERGKGGFAGMNDFLDRVVPDAAEARALIHSGALDRFSPERKHRAALLWQFSAWQRGRSPDSMNRSLFADPGQPSVPPLPPDDPRQNLRREFAVLGFLCDRHPMTLFSPRLERLHTIKAIHVARHPGCRVRFAGWLITGKTILTGRGDPMKFVTFEDETGVVEAVFFPGAYNRFCHILEYGRPFLLSGRVETNWGVATLNVDRVQPV